MAKDVWKWPASQITRAVDGDTFTARLTKVTPVTIDIGFHGSVDFDHVVTFNQRLRLNRINAKPAKTEEGKRATAFVASLVAGPPVYLETVAPYKYGDEWMAEVMLPDGTNVSDALVTAGLAVYWDGTGRRPDA
jgi:endonuclease YncB( thermonuclease family)